MQSLNSKVLQQCCRVFVLTVFGYIHEYEDILGFTIPLLINYICLKYYNDGDSFDKSHCCVRLQRTNYEITQKHHFLNTQYVDWLLNNIDSTCWLKNVISQGKYLWHFEINIKSINSIVDDYRDSMSLFFIGIYESSQQNWESIKNLSTRCLFDNFGTSYLMGIRTLDNQPIIIGPSTILPAKFDSGHYCIRMILNMNDLTLTISDLTNFHQLAQFKIAQGSYVAGVIIGHSSYSVKLIKSSFIYTDN